MENEWIDWYGGECPVEPTEKLEVTLRGGETLTRIASQLFWDIKNSASDIIKYRVIEPTPENILEGFKRFKWNTFSKLEPVGVKVLVMTEDYQVLKAFRKTHAVGYNKAPQYYYVDSGEPFSDSVKPVMWAYC